MVVGESTGVVVVTEWTTNGAKTYDERRRLANLDMTHKYCVEERPVSSIAIAAPRVPRRQIPTLGDQLVISVKQIQAMQRAALKAQNSRIAFLCTDALRAPLDATHPAVQSLTRELPFQRALALGHTMHRQGNSVECSKCGRSGYAKDTAAGVSTRGPIFDAHCGEAP